MRIFQNVKYLSMPESTTVTAIEDIGILADAPIDDSEECEVVQGEIIGVVSAEEYRSCLSCMVKVKALGGEIMGVCNKCTMKVKLSVCEITTTACVMFRAVGGANLKVTLFHKELEAIVAGVTGQCLEENLFNPASSEA